jgi:hypothetical protein
MSNYRFGDLDHVLKYLTAWGPGTYSSFPLTDIRTWSRAWFGIFRLPPYCGQFSFFAAAS